MTESPNSTLTAVPGLAVGHAQDEEAGTGCTVVLGPFRAAVDIRGFAAGTRQFGALAPNHIVPLVDAVLLTGGSAYGLAAADGVARWLEERGRGFETDVARVAIVPTAVIFDLGAGRADRRPDAEMGRAACEAASTGPVSEGRVGVGTGATVGKLFGPDGAMPGGLGSWAEPLEGHAVGTLTVVNAFGDVTDGRGTIVAGARDETGAFVDTSAYLREHGPPSRFQPPPGTNTTLGLVATDLALTRTDLRTVARIAMNAMIRRLSPASSPFDGDLVIACSTGSDPRPRAPAELLRVGLVAEAALGQAMERAVPA
ncbi:MAG: P1 family peptidase [Gemmatimonadetes bacterium]|uniref:P1 family peptidase n=1 Tax=Candidatus Kutchimonas denitrificans TaxID=3056748 RepID=A0AAE4ZDJ1_9BACT|nr:P1 family peptidase [Gemmatimonadota bacterium]NIR76480.1 P1 family peptidase [Candidatus Kutchimonas denitrificans]NIS03298.1 P1 family peptidase [Gemmatimonadota bacterium]NIT69159.1 P1 family peptidase [Gemmatimonadota bacterium]NIU54551.1 peptidase S58 family protein [Gemmatimonadota bacterium]